MNTFLEDLQWRGLVHQCTDLEALSAALDAGPATLYCGFDPTASSLHVGNLVPLLALARFQREGHRALALVGGATGLIGDPSGKSAERVLQTPEDVKARVGDIKRQLGQFINVEDERKGKLVNNLDWTQNLSVLDFLRDIGKHFSVNAMIHRDSVRSRLERDGEGISFTEFSYMLLQAQDFLHLAEQEGCMLQIGGSDQWGNMCSGADLIRRKLSKPAFALTFPLLTTSDGQKFGKTVKGAVWLDASRTSVWEFFQFWLNVPDADVIQMLKLFTFVPRAEIEQLEQAVATAPEQRQAQRRLAREVTGLVHGQAAAHEVELVAEVIFGRGEPASLSAGALAQLALAVPLVQLSPEQLTQTLAQVMVALKLERSISKANELIRTGAVTVSGIRVTETQGAVAQLNWLHDRFLLIRKGKKTFAMVERTA